MPGTQDKAAWRAWARALRAELPDVSAPITRLLAAFLRDRLGDQLDGRLVLAYRALPGEPDVSALDLSNGGPFALATTRARFRPTPQLTLHPWASASEPSRFGALQPPADAPQVARADVGALLLPGLAFDRAGTRLGYGGGFYDRLLADWPGVLTIGVLPSALLLDGGRLPRDAHDCPVDYLATEESVRAVEPDSAPPTRRP